MKWQNGGTGLPSDEQHAKAVSGNSGGSGSNASSGSGTGGGNASSGSGGSGGRGSGSGNGGADFEWKRRAFLRAQERVRQEGGCVDDEIRERWGCSAAELLGGEEQLARVVARDARRSAHARDRFTAFYKGKMKKPGDSGELKWNDTGNRRSDGSCAVSSNSASSGSTSASVSASASASSRKQAMELQSHRYSSESGGSVRQESGYMREVSGSMKQGSGYMREGSGSMKQKGESMKQMEQITVASQFEDIPPSLPRAFGSTKYSPHGQQQQQLQKQQQQQLQRTIAAPLTPEEMNKLAAKALKAQLIGDMETFNRLNAQIEETKQSSAQSKAPIAAEVVVLPKYDIKGRKIAQSSSHNPANADDIREVARRMKESGGLEDLRVTRRSMMHTRGDTEEDFDGMNENMFDEEKRHGKRKRGKHGVGNEEDSQRDAKRNQIREYNKMKSLFDECRFCYTGKNFKKHLLLSLGEKTLLMLPPFDQLVPYHCVITTVEHRIAVTLADEDETNEILRFKQSLAKMFMAQDQECLFLETVTPFQLQKQRHTILECIPVPSAVAQQASGYFKKAILDSDAEWSQNKKLIDTRGKGVRRCIPKDFPYFHVEFGLNGGFAHVIEDESKFPFTFGKQVIAGMLKMSPNAVKVNKHTSVAEEEKQRKQFLAIWKDFDWTVSLDGGAY